MSNQPDPNFCRSCGAPIFMPHSVTSGKRMPVDAEPVEDGNVLIAVDKQTGVLKAKVIGKDDQVDAARNRYVSHFATCPDADGWRKSAPDVPATTSAGIVEPPLVAITLHSPWAQCIIHGTKRVENRSWRPPANVRGQRLAIHCGLGVDKESWDWLKLQAADQGNAIDYAPNKGRHHAGCIVGAATVVGVRKDRQVHMFVDQDPPADLDEDPWYSPGNYGWLLDDVVAYQPIKTRGYQRVWPIKSNLRSRFRPYDPDKDRGW